MKHLEYQAQFLVEGDGAEMDHRTIEYVKGAIAKALANGRDIRWVVTLTNKDDAIVTTVVSEPNIPSPELREKAWK